jgi:hypothetical protein
VESGERAADAFMPNNLHRATSGGSSAVANSDRVKRLEPGQS